MRSPSSLAAIGLASDSQHVSLVPAIGTRETAEPQYDGPLS